MSKLRTALMCLLLVTGAQATPSAVTIEQIGKKFSVAEITVKKGDTVTFTNKDTIIHNIYSQSAGNAFELKTQKPGESSDISFSQTGVADVRCAIHPTMKLRINVVE